MEIIENTTKFGTTFILKYHETRLNEGLPSIGSWLLQNNIQFIYNRPDVHEHHYFIKDEAGIMAFKLRWL